MVPLSFLKEPRVIDDMSSISFIRGGIAVLEAETDYFNARTARIAALEAETDYFNARRAQLSWAAAVLSDTAAAAPTRRRARRPAVSTSAQQASRRTLRPSPASLATPRSGYADQTPRQEPARWTSTAHTRGPATQARSRPARRPISK